MILSVCSTLVQTVKKAVCMHVLELKGCRKGDIKIISREKKIKCVGSEESKDSFWNAASQFLYPVHPYQEALP